MMPEVDEKGYQTSRRRVGGGWGWGGFVAPGWSSEMGPVGGGGGLFAGRR